MYVSRHDLFPLVFSFVWDEITDSDIEDMRRDFDLFHSRNRRFLLITDSRGANLPNAKMRRSLAELAASYLELTKRNVAYQCVVVSGRATAGALTAIQWLAGRSDIGNNTHTAELALTQGLPAVQLERLPIGERAWEFVRAVDAAQKVPETLTRLRRRAEG